MAGKSGIGKEIKENDIVLFLISDKRYPESVKDIAAAAAKTFSKICYVSLNKPFDTLVSIFNKSGVDTDKIVFVDCVSGGFKKTGGANVVFVSSPKALTEMDIAIKKALDKEKFQGLVFDSLSTLLVYEEPFTVIKFSHSVISKLRNAKAKGVFLTLKGDIKSELVKDLGMFVDKVVEA